MFLKTGSVGSRDQARAFPESEKMEGRSRSGINSDMTGQFAKLKVKYLFLGSLVVVSSEGLLRFRDGLLRSGAMSWSVTCKEVMVRVYFDRVLGRFLERE